MKKTLLVLVVALLLVPAGLFASLFNLSLGATAQYTGAFDASQVQEFDWAQLANIENYGFGADVRVKVLFAEVGVSALYSQGVVDNETLYALSGLVTGGVSLDLLGLVRVGIGMGPRVNALFDDHGNGFVWSGTDLITADTDFAALFMDAPMTYRATADINLGGILVGLNYTVDSFGFTFNNMNTLLLAPDLENGRIGASVLFTLF
ncbi:MAG: hypothetical protein CVV52_00765 [Spirochaetae bacterium HGW-Spirochaetae-8]|jgi:hypothetical protein|nr:MAG: hypothetical protein CVV52_00765 [Spirochaetae bacterium HGW-Spirochaetae-8]